MLLENYTYCSQSEELLLRRKKNEEIQRQQWIEEQQRLEREQIVYKIKERHRIKQLEKIIRQELIDSGELFGEQPKRPPIPKEVVDAVYTRDGGRCVYCGSIQNIHIDHIIPFSKGGATNVENLQLLCQKCNLEKSNKIG
ncbi:MAG: HNH endonuclease [Rikenellaceae bacterium]|nr:HNH endonuclease [Rikenellaceae bacterium]